MVLEVKRTERIAPQLVRIVVGGPGFAEFADRPETDKYVKILFADPSLGLTPPYDMDALRERLAPEQMPSRRTYTVRAVDAEAQEITLDFVTHGDRGIAGPWAASAQPGDLVAFTGPGGGYEPDPAADWHFLVGDDSAVPAIAAALEAMPADATGVVLLEVDGPADTIDLAAPTGMAVRWVYRDGAPAGSEHALVSAVRDAPWQAGDVQVFAHGEREAMKELRDYFLGERGLERRRVSLSAYWAYGRDEDTFQAEKREPIGQILPPG